MWNSLLKIMNCVIAQFPRMYKALGLILTTAKTNKKPNMFPSSLLFKVFKEYPCINFHVKWNSLDHT